MDSRTNTTPPDETVLRGEVHRITFRNEENGYTVLQLIKADSNEPFTVVGYSFGVSTGSTILVRGKTVAHKKFGTQFQASSITATTPDTPEGLIAYLASGVVKGVGQRTAERIVAELGNETMEVIYKDPLRLASIEGVGEHKAKLISEAFSSEGSMREIMRFLIEHKISQNLAMKIYARYGAKAVELLARDPYLLARTGGIKGVGFITADTIAAQLGITHEAPQRLRAGLYYALERSLDDGHVFLPEDDLTRKTRELLSLSNTQDLTTPLQELANEGALVIQDRGVYLKPLLRAESFVGNFVAERATPYHTPLMARELVEECLNAAESALAVTFSAEQRTAALRATEVPLLLITGGPGCGKTTIIRALSLMFRAAGKRLALTAPTGRAAQRMSSVCEMPASTIHRLLKYDPSTGGFIHGIHDPLPIDALIVDEASMVDLMLAKDLFSAVPMHAPIILVGDRDQLPSVGPGRVFGDLLSLHFLPIISLSRLYRRSDGSIITSIAHEINAGITPSIPSPDGKTKTDAYFLPIQSAEEGASLVERLVLDQLPKKFSIPPTDIAVLTPSNRGPLGSLALNARLQGALNPARGVEEELTQGEALFRLGDRVCQRVNNYQIDPFGVYNGDGGVITKVDAHSRTLSVELWDGRLIKYDTTTIAQLSLAYALTVHRSQGSEYPCVVLVLHDAHYTLLERQLVYTGITRAKKLLIVVGTPRALTIAAERASTQKRHTRLREAITTARERATVAAPTASE
jgi:exodeoxyribonuclease V alpha subunit